MKLGNIEYGFVEGAIHEILKRYYEIIRTDEPLYYKMFPCYVMIRNKNKKKLNIL